MLLGFLGRLGLIIALNHSAHEALRIGMAGKDSAKVDSSARFLVPSLLFACTRKGCDGFLKPDDGGHCTRHDDKNIKCPQTRPPLPTVSLECKNLTNTLRRIYTLKFVPRDLFGRVAAHIMANEFPGVTIHPGWITVSLVDHETRRPKSRLFLLLREESRSWEVSSMGEEPERLFRFAISTLLTVLGFYRDLEYETVLVCPWCSQDAGAEAVDAKSDPQGNRGCISFSSSFNSWMNGSSDSTPCARSKADFSLRVALPDIARADVAECKEAGGLLIDRTAKLGDGAFGAVYRGSLHRRPVAVKLLKTNDNNADSLAAIVNEYVHEVEIMASSLSPFLVRLLAVGSSLDGQPVMVTELLDGGSLWHRLHPQNTPLLTWKMRARIASDIAQGLACLHGCSSSNKETKTSMHRPIAHRDLRSPNILLNHRQDNEHAPVVAKLADFGLSARVVTEIHADSGDRPPDYEPRWLAPEVMAGRSHDERVDLYSLGIVLWELAATPSVPFDPKEWPRWDGIEAAVKNGERPKKPSWSEMKEKTKKESGVESNDSLLILDCFSSITSSGLWNHSPDERPGAAVVAERLIELCDSLEIKSKDDQDWVHLSKSMSVANKDQIDVIGGIVDVIGALQLRSEHGSKQGSLAWKSFIRQEEISALDRFYSTRGAIEEFTMFAAASASVVTGQRRVTKQIEGAEEAARVVENIFLRQVRSRAFNVISLQACISPRCLSRFYARFMELKEKPRVELLFHYCAPSLLPVLCKSGPSSFFTRGGWFGDGIYFSSLPEYALDGYAYREWRAYDKSSQNELCRLAVRFRRGTARQAFVFREGSESLEVEPWRRLRITESKGLFLDWDTGDRSAKGWFEQARGVDEEPEKPHEIVIMPVKKSMIASKTAADNNDLEEGFHLEANVEESESNSTRRFTIWAKRNDEEKFAAVILEISMNDQGNASAGRYRVDTNGKKRLSSMIASFEAKCAPWKKVAPWMRLRVFGKKTALLWQCSAVPLSSDPWPFRTVNEFNLQAGGLKTVPSMLESLHSRQSHPPSVTSTASSEADSSDEWKQFFDRLDIVVDSDNDDRLLSDESRDDWRVRALACMVICGDSKAVRRRDMEDELCSKDVENGCGGIESDGHLTHKVMDDEMEEETKEKKRHDLATREIVVPVRKRDESGVDWSCDSQILPRFVIEFGPFGTGIMKTAGIGDAKSGKEKEK